MGLAYDAGIVLLTISKGRQNCMKSTTVLRWGHGTSRGSRKTEVQPFGNGACRGLQPFPIGCHRQPHGENMASLPVIKQAFEEVFKALFIIKILLAELGPKAGKETFLVINFDGTFEEGSRCAVLAATQAVEQDMLKSLRAEPANLTLEQAAGAALRTWALGDRLQRQAAETEAEEGAKDRRMPRLPITQVSMRISVERSPKKPSSAPCWTAPSRDPRSIAP